MRSGGFKSTLQEGLIYLLSTLEDPLQLKIWENDLAPYYKYWVSLLDATRIIKRHFNRYEDYISPDYKEKCLLTLSVTAFNEGK